MQKKSTVVKILSVALTVLMLLGAVPTESFAQGIEDPISNSTGSGWEDFWGMEYDTGADFKDDKYSPFVEDETDDIVPAEDLNPVDDSAEPTDKENEKNGEAEVEVETATLGLSGAGSNFPWAVNLTEAAEKIGAVPQARFRRSATDPFPSDISGIGTREISWSGGNIVYDGPAGDPYWVGSGYLHTISYGGPNNAICAQFNGNAAFGSYRKSTEGTDPQIKQWIANYDASSKDDYATGTLQTLVWSRLVGHGISSWGGFPVDNQVMNGTADPSNVKYWLYEANPTTSSTQNIFIYDNNTEPGEPDPDPEPGGDGSAWGQVTIIKKDEDDNPLKNAIFKIDITFANGSKGGSDRFQVVDGANTYTYTHPEGDIGKAKVTVTEVEAPDGYIADSTPQTVHISPTYHIYEEDGDGEVIKDEWKQGDYGPAIELTFKNYPEEASLTIYKYEKGNSGIGLAGAEFEIKAADTGQNWSTMVTTDARGYAHISLPRAGTYTIRETKAPKGYEIDVDNDGNSIITMEVARGEHKEIDVPNNKKGGLRIYKRDAQDQSVYLSGATFRVTHIATGEYKEGVTDNNGLVEFHDLAIGSYYVEETKAPQFYELDKNNKRKIEVRDGSFETITMYFDNEPWTGIRIIKLDSKNANRLSGAVFGLYEGADMGPDGYPTGQLKSEYTSNENGEVVIRNLRPGYYTIVEHQPPDGYALDKNDVRTIRVDPADPDRTIQVIFRNDPLPKLKIIKRDQETGNLLSGATFKVRHEDGAVYDDVTTGPNGTILLEKMPIGWYTIEEIKSPQGYLPLEDDIPPVELVVGKTTEVVVYNQKQPALEIIKKDKVTGDLLPGAVFRVSWNDGADYRDVEIAENGKAVLEGLKKGWYTITEIKAPEGYLLDDTPHQIYLEGDKEAVIEIFNEKEPSLTIKKVDDKTKTPLQYAKFKIEKKTETGTELVGEFVSDENGIVRLDNIKPGRYLVTEIEAPDGYVINNKTQEVTIEHSQDYELEFVNTAQNPIYIKKVDEKGNPLAGATLRITTMNGSLVKEVTTAYTGIAIVPYVDPGFYLITEVCAPEGYILSNVPQTVELKINMPAEVTFVNQKAPGLTILKLEEETGEPLIGAKFKIRHADGKEVGIYETGIDGIIRLESLEPGSYVITEIRAPEGCVLDATPHMVTLEADKDVQIEIYNKRVPGLQIYKQDSITGLPVAGATFNITKLDGASKTDFGTHTTGENGIIFLTDMEADHYTITEIKSADGYILDPTPKQVYIENGKTIAVEFFNTPYSDLRLVKIDSETRDPLPGAIFKLFDDKRIEVDTYTTSELGEIYVSGLPSGEYYLQEVKAPAGYVLDNTVRKVELIPGKVVTVEVKNIEKGSLRLIKKDTETGRPIQGVSFLIYDSKNNIVGEFVTDQNGIITLPNSFTPQKIKIKEIKAATGYVLDDKPISVIIKAGETTEVVVKNELALGCIQIIKVSDSYNDITKDKEGTALKSAKFEIYNNRRELVDTIVTDRNGTATSIDLPLGVYGIKEVEAPNYYYTDGEMFFAEIKIHKDLVTFKVKNTPIDLKTTIEKRGVVETKAGESIYYSFSNISNSSNVPLDEFYWHDKLPTEAVRLEKIWTGIWSERSRVEVQIKTNLKPEYRTIKTGLLSSVNNEIDCSPQALRLASNEYVTDFKVVFGTVQAGCKETTQPKVQVKVLDNFPNQSKFTNETDVGGRYNNEWVYEIDGWTTVVFNIPKGKLPKTGY